MATREQEHLANEAQRLINDDVLNEALAQIKVAAYEALASTDADDKTAILRLQQTIAVIDDIGITLEGFILEGQGQLIRPVA